jgi:hypothetical protein
MRSRSAETSQAKAGVLYSLHLLSAIPWQMAMERGVDASALI